MPLINKIILFAKSEIMGGIVSNLIAFRLFLGAIGFFASTGKMAEMFCWKIKSKIEIFLFIHSDISIVLEDTD